MNTLIQATEIWVPDAEGSLLEFGDGLYASAVEFGAISRSMCFGRAEGLPGRVWDEARPILLTDLQGGHFRRAAAAEISFTTSRLNPAITECSVVFVGHRQNPS